MLRNFLASVSFLFLFLLAACSSGAEKAANNSTAANSSNAANASPGANSAQTTSKPLPEDVVKVSAASVEAQAGKSAQAMVKVAVKEGYHINANPASQYQIATQLTVEPPDGITVGQTVYPPALTKKFSFSEQPLAVYEGEATITVPLNVSAGAAKGDHNISARLRFQACDDQVCYPPKNLQTLIPLTVK